MAATTRPIDVQWKLIPAGKGMMSIQSDPLPEADAKLRMADLEKEENPGEPEEPENEGEDMGAMRKPQGMPPFGKKPEQAGMMAMRGPGGAMAAASKPGGGMPPFAGM